MTAGILIDLGPKWGQIIRLDRLENVIQIEQTPENQLRVYGEVMAEGKTQAQSFKFTSVKPFTDDELVIEKARMLGFTNGLISRSDMETIFASVELQTGVKPKVILDQPVYDISFLRRVWASLQGQPYFRFVLQYDPEAGTIVVDESHNQEFLPIIPDWIGKVSAALVQDVQDQLLLFAYEAIFQLAEPLLPEGEEGAMIDPMADIPIMGSGNRQQVDLGRIHPGQIMQTTK